MKGIALFALGTTCGAVFVAWALGVRPPEPPTQVTLLTRPAPPPPSPAVPAALPIIAAETPMAAAPVPSTAPPTAAAPLTVAAPAPPASSAAPPESRGSLVIPVAGVSAPQLRDNFNERRGNERHEALDIMAPRGTPVVAVEDGRIAKLFTSKPGGLTIYQFDPSEKFAYYYAHLDHYAQGLAEGRIVRRGEVIGYVGSTGNASPAAPHLHFTIYALGPDKRWWKGQAINPYPLLTATP